MNSVRYSRQERLPEVGPNGQKALENSKVLIVGLGGLGCPAAAYLAAAGIGALGLVDGDRIDQTNLHRQLLYSDKDIGQPKVTVAKRQLGALNSLPTINEYFEPLDWSNAKALLSEYDLILDCTDNFEVKYLLNDACLEIGRPLITASASGFEANLMVISKDGPCLRCLYPKATAAADVGSCSLTGILGAFVGIVGSWQAAEALKFILIQSHGKQISLTPTQGQVLFFDFYTSQMRAVQLEKKPSCFCSRSQKADQPQESSRKSLYLTREQVRKLNQYVLVDVRSLEEKEEEVFSASTQGLNPKCDILHRPFTEIVSEDFDDAQWHKNTAYVLFCRQGQRSIQAAQWLREHGVSQAYSLRA